MLSMFPEIMFLSPFAALFIRIALALVIFYDGWSLFSKSGNTTRIAALCAFTAGALLFVGAWTQLIAIALVVTLLAEVLIPSWKQSTLPSSTLALMIVMALTLVVTGAGPIAFDLPL